jgi:ATP-dependent DNA ligase
MFWPSVPRIDGILFSEALGAEGAAVFAKGCKLGLEGVVSKPAGSSYQECRAAAS